MESVRDLNGRRTFKEVFKFYRNRNPLGITNVDDLLNTEDWHGICNFQGKKNEIEISTSFLRGEWETSYGMKNPENWEVFTFTSKPGLIYIRNPFKAYGQRYWIARCLMHYTRKPNRLNIDAHNLLHEKDDWWEYCHRDHSGNEGNHVLNKLRWVTLGYHHNWDTKEYSEDLRSTFPDDLRLFCKDIGEVLGFSQFNAEAGIINLYHKDSCLNGHTDHSERNLDAPLFSFSFGQSAIFLIGGKSLNEEPLSLLLESGDIIVMSNEARLCYHGVPKIVVNSKKTWNMRTENDKTMTNPALNSELLHIIKDNALWEPFDSYVNKSRINMNIRQVLLLGQTGLS